MKHLNRSLAAAAAALAALALVAGDGGPAPATVDLGRLARMVEREEDHVTALQLADWIRAQRSQLRVFDIRAKAAFDEYHIPTAEHVPLGSITAMRINPNDTVVLYSDAGTHAAQAWFILQARGLRHVYFLRGGLYEWLDDVMNPRSPNEQGRALMEYFGGQPDRASGEADGHQSLSERVRRMRRRTC